MRRGLYEESDRIVSLTINQSQTVHVAAPETRQALIHARTRCRDAARSLVAIRTGAGGPAFRAGAFAGKRKPPSGAR